MFSSTLLVCYMRYIVKRDKLKVSFLSSLKSAPLDIFFLEDVAAGQSISQAHTVDFSSLDPLFLYLRHLTTDKAFTQALHTKK